MLQPLTISQHLFCIQCLVLLSVTGESGFLAPDVISRCIFKAGFPPLHTSSLHNQCISLKLKNIAILL